MCRSFFLSFLKISFTVAFHLLFNSNYFDKWTSRRRTNGQLSQPDEILRRNADQQARGERGNDTRRLCVYVCSDPNAPSSASVPWRDNLMTRVHFRIIFFTEMWKKGSSKKWVLSERWYTGQKKNTLGISSSSVSTDVNWEETKNSENFDATMHVFKSDAT